MTKGKDQVASGLKLSGSARIVRTNEKGQITLDKRIKNLVVNAGIALIADLLDSGETVNQPSHIACGTSSTAVSATQTALIGTELDRNSATPSNTATTFVMSATFAAGEGTGTWEEAGVFNAASTGTMLCRFLTGTVTKGASDSITVTWTLTISAS